ncbi:hypothetical protein [Pseudodesulfovibrio sp.]|uniref:hypothetical protein n=1 Tax=unclassified Pseudodesulfovibrio TaxID=2661612 RepID=UPI003AFFFE98
MKSRRQKAHARERTRNILIVLVAIGMIVVFFNLNFVSKGESVFSKNASQKLRFAGRLGHGYYSKAEQDRLMAFIKRYNKEITTLTVEASPQDTYGGVDEDTPILFELHLLMSDGAVINTPVIRSSRGQLIPAVLVKLRKDMKVYLALKKQGKHVDTLLNVM